MVIGNLSLEYEGVIHPLMFVGAIDRKEKRLRGIVEDGGREEINGKQTAGRRQEVEGRSCKPENSSKE